MRFPLLCQPSPEMFFCSPISCIPFILLMWTSSATAGRFSQPLFYCIVYTQPCLTLDQWLFQVHCDSVDNFLYLKFERSTMPCNYIFTGSRDEGITTWWNLSPILFQKSSLHSKVRVDFTQFSFCAYTVRFQVYVFIVTCSF